MQLPDAALFRDFHGHVGRNGLGKAFGKQAHDFGEQRTVNREELGVG
jgi:hypothetical protein